MNLNKELIQKEVDNNFKFFQENLDELINKHQGKFVLIREQKIVGYFDSSKDALADGKKRFPDGIFSIQEITKDKLCLGALEYAYL